MIATRERDMNTYVQLGGTLLDTVKAGRHSWAIHTLAVRALNLFQ